MKMAVFWVVAPCNLAEDYRLFRRTSASETSVNLYRTIRCNSPEDSHAQTSWPENSKSHAFLCIRVRFANVSVYICIYRIPHAYVLVGDHILVFMWLFTVPPHPSLSLVPTLQEVTYPARALIKLCYRGNSPRLQHQQRQRSNSLAALAIWQTLQRVRDKA
jgi:cellulose synthase/poly-beta-1,6-N-acetylglucosamine synthase-like glycosyltransferase